MALGAAAALAGVATGHRAGRSAPRRTRPADRAGCREPTLVTAAPGPRADCRSLADRGVPPDRGWSPGAPVDRAAPGGERRAPRGAGGPRAACGYGTHRSGVAAAGPDRGRRPPACPGAPRALAAGAGEPLPRPAGALCHGGAEPPMAGSGDLGLPGRTRGSRPPSGRSAGGRSDPPRPAPGITGSAGLPADAG